MNKVWNTIRPAVLCFLIMTVICGIIYPGVIMGIAQIALPRQANGSIITATLPDGTVQDVGSELIGQEFTRPEYLIGRPMEVSNLSPTGSEQAGIVGERIAWWHDFDPANQALIPADLVTASGSGVDPNISPEAAEYQVARIAAARDLPEAQVRGIIKTYTTGRFLGFWGEPAVNVLKVNLALDGLS